jgi:hypothetical protein
MKHSKNTRPNSNYILVLNPLIWEYPHLGKMLNITLLGFILLRDPQDLVFQINNNLEVFWFFLKSHCFNFDTFFQIQKPLS